MNGLAILKAFEPLRRTILAVSAVAAALGQGWRGETWNDHQAKVLLHVALPDNTPSSASP